MSDDVDLCGIIMPISGFGDYKASHWVEIKDIIGRAISEANFKPCPVWERSETDIIQGRIITNIYECPWAVCDISGLNPNVMFELGLRLAFKKPVVIITDNTTKIPFDTNSIEHMVYDRNLRFQKTESFIEDLKVKLLSIKDVTEKGNYQAFIDSFGAFSTFEPNPQKMEIDEFVARRLEDISAQVSALRSENSLITNMFFNDRPVSKNALADIVNRTDNDAARFWTPQRESELQYLWEKGATASQIASQLGGVSRNAIIGKAHRLGLKSRPQTESD